MGGIQFQVTNINQAGGQGGNRQRSEYQRWFKT